MPRKPDFSRVARDPSLDDFRTAIAEIVLDDRPVGYLATRVGSVARKIGGRLWWTKWSEPWEVIEFVETRTDDTSPLPPYDDGIDVGGDAVEELRSGTLTRDAYMTPDRDRPVTYSLRWLCAEDVQALWDRYGFRGGGKDWVPSRHDAPKDTELPTETLTLWKSDVVVLFDWLMRVDFDDLPITHPAQKQALVDLLNRIEVGADVRAASQADIDAASEEVARDMDW